MPRVIPVRDRDVEPLARTSVYLKKYAVAATAADGLEDLVHIDGEVGKISASVSDESTASAMVGLTHPSPI
jgi:hypothetical protein